MPDAKEVYEMITKQKPPEPGALERQQKKQVRSARNKKFGAFAVAAAIGIVAVVAIVVSRPSEDAVNIPAGEPTANPVQVGTSFVEAYGTFDAELAISYLAEDAAVSVVGGAGGVGTTPEEWPLNLSWWEATGYEQTLDSCERTGSSASGTQVRCTLDYHNLRSDEIGRGPFGGSYWDITVRDGQIVLASQTCNIDEFSTQMWEPFADWVSNNYPKDAAVMYTEGLDDYVLTEDSIRLWEQHSKEYVKEVDRKTAG